MLLCHAFYLYHRLKLLRFKNGSDKHSAKIQFVYSQPHYLLIFHLIGEKSIQPSG